ncbi:NADP-dependent oxidoreductase [Komagataeibacter europaeus]|uniref:NADP-dependent oxidoreductase n=1 Tax=Komagataeibacter europaeus TaxID=33995 RepID=UPI0002E24F53|nr:NADP-dependent oxidoreductase [Komagataeibacter europaeus]GBQ41058.1 2-alkenal reductase [Komagataeibacter europaeus LMG 18890]
MNSPDTPQNRRIVLASRPSGAPTLANFRLERVPVPRAGAGQVLLKTLWLSLDPYMRGRMSAAPSYAPPVAVGDVMVGGTVARVEQSGIEGYRPGDIVLSYGGWQDYAVSDGTDLMVLPAGMSHLSRALGVLGMPGFTAWYGLLKIGAPKAGETVVVAAASGPVGAVVGQLARLHGATVVGVAGGPEKCRRVREELGFDACLDHRGPDFAAQLAAACPKGIDVYFESVGGKVFDAVLPLLNTFARIPVCGLIAHYNDSVYDGGVNTDPGPDRLPAFMGQILIRRLRVQGFIILEHYSEFYAEFLHDMQPLVESGKIRVFEDIVDGLENAPAAFIGMLEGKNSGKLLVKVSS